MTFYPLKQNGDVSGTAIRVGLAGYGRRGMNLASKIARNNKNSGNALKLIGVYDIDARKEQPIREAGYTWFYEYEELLKNADAILIATSSATHFEMAKRALESGKDVLIEKPSSLRYEDDLELERLSRRYGRLVAVGYSERFNPVITKFKKNVDVSDLHFVTTFRSNPPERGVRDNPGLLWDLGSHDTDLCYYLFGIEPTVVASLQQEDRAFLWLTYNSIQVQIHTSYIPEEKYRYRFSIFHGKRKYYYLNYAEQKYQRFKPSINTQKVLGKTLFSSLPWNTQLLLSKNLEKTEEFSREPLPLMLKWFAASIRAGRILEPLCSISESKITTKAVQRALEINPKFKQFINNAV